ncbi:hypothetical protein DL766_003714 [Monosporascus sp. MC13-8B]|nr:hypothetical protein DL763_006061 [Monosporascus cannonballus]RYP32990.1 hypothetical protein DL766_003714 [Monosporascus sp. MC13-8B]
MSEVRAPPRDKARNYVNSKTGNVFLASEFARRTGSSRLIISVCQNPGAAATKLFRHTPWLNYVAFPLLHKASLAALTALYAGLPKDITLDVNGCYVVPWGRIHQNLRADLVEAMMPAGEGGSGRATEFWDFCAEMTRDYC